MKALGSLLANQKLQKQSNVLDEKTIFFLFEKIIKQEYGNRGVVFVQAKKYTSDKILFISIPQSSVWSNEIWLYKKEIIKQINEEVGDRVVNEIKIVR